MSRIESLDERLAPAINAVFALGTLSVTGDDQNNNIEISRSAVGDILVNGGTVNIRGGKPTVANTRYIILSGQGGDDTLKLNETNGTLPRASLYGGFGKDALIGGSGNDRLFGQAGNDNLQGMAGVDQLFGGAGDDILTGGSGIDEVYGEGGNDKLVWNPGDNTDFNEGGAGSDTVEVNGGEGSEGFTATANGQRVRFDRLDPSPFFIDIGTSERLLLNANGGDDRFHATGNLASLISITVNGGAGNDTLSGSNGNDLLTGGDGVDFVDGQQGDDIVNLGSDDDVFQWDPGDGSDSVDGQDGKDKLQFNGSAIGEIIDLSTNGDHARLTRNIGNITMDLDGIEQFDLVMLGGTDAITVNDLQGSDVVTVNIALAAGDGVTGDTQPDTVFIQGTNANDIIDVFGSDNTLSVIGLSAQVWVSGSEAALDTLVINSLAGNDGLSASTLVPGIVKLILAGGADNDVLLGSQGPDTLNGGEGNDLIEGQQGDDLITMGTGDDLMQWEPGDGSDVVDGEGGADKLFFFGSHESENFDIFANNGRVRFQRNISAVSLDLDNIEFMEVRALAGADNFSVGDLTGTDLVRMEIDLRGAQGGGDGGTDTISLFGTQGDDSINVAGDSGGLNITGLPTQVQIFQQESANDQLTISALGGADTVSSVSLKPDSVQLSILGGLGIDTLIGGDSNELFNGGDGDDLISMGGGDDIFVWNPGDDNDTIDGQLGFDKLLFNGSNIAEKMAISSNGDHARFTRDVANISLDLNHIEGLDIQTLGGADVVTVNDLTGTDVIEVNIVLSTLGGGDSQADTVILNGTDHDDTVLVAGDGTGQTIFGLSAQLNLFGFESTNDRLVINALAGDDVVDASALQVTAMMLTVDGGANDDIIIGGDGADVLFGDEGDDILMGGPGVDVLDGGAGDNIVIQD